MDIITISYVFVAVCALVGAITIGTLTVRFAFWTYEAIRVRISAWYQGYMLRRELRCDWPRD